MNEDNRILLKYEEGKNFPELGKGDSYIYALYDRLKCLYVGQTKNINHRLTAHKSDGKVFDRVILSISTNYTANDFEAHDIVNLKPVLNRVLPATDSYVSKSYLRQSLIAMVNNFSDREIGLVLCKGHMKYIDKAQADKIMTLFNSAVIEAAHKREVK